MDKEFNPPVVIARENRAGRRTIASAWEALEWLRLRRPACTGPRYRSAVRICRDVLDGLRAPPDARRAFISAAREVGRRVF
ncbi:DUF982 domain-containing protein [Aminobacter sp. NyZ550]|uniref:DUF982 domain-containing protein n=1 Tax=Aminobacter TaxID=31988 RepID=UPI000A05CA8E|nr:MULTISPECIES: DUF982 domain-containing protein [Aminobacter]MRX33606.1 DUF982 domain-containing protein [Aminobacter sp. MDW-2]QNH33348.1 DUF982 domain-containing protein [Aminobacter sp. MDW-2]WAX94326.1 DUF982 domain-containing protein [Aminobacter sp. NyZ550]WMC98832.1 DUF982 domain-containing protein [Aminobacter aminovorans]BBD37160.1 hypothetical protein Amn_20400 [Aminobacter sp. SS-2016]